MFNIHRDDLYDVPIEKLNLTVKTFNLFKRTGLDSVGDCLDLYFDFWGGYTYNFRLGLIDPLEKEVFPKIVEYLHDNHLENNDNIAMFNINRIELYDIGIEELNLTSTTDDMLRRNGIVGIGDVIDIIELFVRPSFDAIYDPPPHSRFTDERIQELITKTVEYLIDNHLMIKDE